MKSLRDYIKLVEGAGNDPLGLVAEIRAHENVFRMHCGHEPDSPFHLSPCTRCHSPVWTSPCPVCESDMWGGVDRGMRTPDGRARRFDAPDYDELAKPYRDAAPKKYADLITRHGNFGVWYFDRLKNSVLYDKNKGIDPSLRYQPLPQPTDKQREEMKVYTEELDRMIEVMRHQHFPSAEAIFQAYGKTK